MNSSRAVEVVQPGGWPRPKGYANGMRVPAGWDLLFVAGQIGWDGREKLVGPGFAEQFERALANCVEVVRAAGGSPEHIVRLTCYATDRRAYLDALPAVGEAWRRTMGRHYPCMALVEVAALVEPGALIEIEATAALPPNSGDA